MLRALDCLAGVLQAVVVVGVVVLVVVLVSLGCGDR